MRLRANAHRSLTDTVPARLALFGVWIQVTSDTLGANIEFIGVFGV